MSTTGTRSIFRKSLPLLACALPALILLTQPVSAAGAAPSAAILATGSAAVQGLLAQPGDPAAPENRRRGAAGETQRQARHDFELNPEKARAFLELLAPDDVKVLVGLSPNGVYIKGTQREARVLNAFVKLIKREEHREVQDLDRFIEEVGKSWDSVETYALPEHKSDALFRMLAFNDVPVLVARVPEGVKVEASKADQRTIAMVVDILRGEQPGQEVKERRRRPRPEERQRQEQRARRGQDEQRKQNLIDALREQKEALERHARELQEQAQRLQEEANRLKEEMREQVHQIAEQIAAATEGRGDGSPAQRWDRRRAPEDGDPDLVVVRRYVLPEHHAKNLFSLLAPDDIRDVIVSRHGEEIEVRAKVRDQRTIEELVEILTRTHRPQERERRGLRFERRS